jgi:hypothetical protein
MASLLQNEMKFQLPARIRSKHASQEGCLARLLLADRIAELPGIETVENDPARLPCSITIHLIGDNTRARKQKPPVLFCRISKDGINLQGLSDRDRYQVLARGWGMLAQDSVLVYLPQDEHELEVCWSILQHAYHALLGLLLNSSPRQNVAAGELPQFSRTTLQ